MRGLIILVIVLAMAASPMGTDGAAIARGLLLGVAFGLLTIWHWAYVVGWNARVEAELEETTERAEARAEDARR